MTPLLLACLVSASAQDAGGTAVSAALHGDAKLFFVASLPQDLPASGLGVADFRLKGTLSLGKHWSAAAHHNVTWFGGGAINPLGAGAGAGVGLLAPELVKLTWQADTNGTNLTIRGRTDRLWLRFSPEHLDVTVGRQPVTLGAGTVFTPMDVVNPFSPAIIDTEYKPGVDAVRVDAYAGVSTRLSAIAAWAGAPLLDPDRGDVSLHDVILVANAQATLGATDLQVLAGLVRQEGVFGAGFAGGIGPVALHGDATLTLPAEGEREQDPFVRAVLGADWRPTTTTTLSSELYYAGFGTGNPDEYLARLMSPRVLRGEVWQVGRYYASLVVVQEITPLVVASVAAISNVEDPSVFLAPTISWSVSNEASLAAGAYFSLGGRPDFSDPLNPELTSEFGTYPPSAFAQLRAYF